MPSNMEDIDSHNTKLDRVIAEDHVIKPIKKAHRIANKTIVVLDDILVKRLSIDEFSTWFEEEQFGNGILLKVHKFRGLIGEEQL